MKTINKIHRYSPKPAGKYTKALNPLECLQEEAWNLLYLVADMEDPLRFTQGRHEIPAHAWLTVRCCRRTGKHNPEPGTPIIAGLLGLPPQEFVDWAKNTPIIEHLPLTALVPDWVEVAQSRLHLCRPHPDAGKRTYLDDITDVSQASNLLAKYR